MQDLSIYVKPLKSTKSRKTYECGEQFLCFPLSLYQSIVLAIAITGSPSPSEVNQRGCSSDQPIEGPQKGLKVPILVSFEVKMVIIADLDYSAVF